VAIANLIVVRTAFISGNHSYHLTNLRLIGEEAFPSQQCFPRALAWPYLKPLHWQNMKVWIACCAFYADRLAGGKVIHDTSS
jgi:hypothetical protein